MREGIEEAKKEKSRAYHREYSRTYRAKNIEKQREYDRIKAREYRAKDMYASDNREYYTGMLILPYVERKVSKREHIKGMDAKGLQRGLRIVLEGIADSEEYKNSVQDGDFSKCAIMDC